MDDRNSYEPAGELDENFWAQLSRLGHGPESHRTIDGRWPIQLTSLSAPSGQLENAARAHFDIFFPTRAVVLEEHTGSMRRRRFAYRPGMVGFTPPGRAWSVSWIGQLEGVGFLIEPATMTRAAETAFPGAGPITWRQALSDHAPSIAYLGLDIASLAVSGRPAGHAHLETLLEAFMALIVRRYSMTARRDLSRVGVLSRQVLNALEYIDADPTRAISVMGLADAANTSPAHLNRLFRSELGDSVASFVRRRRLRAARRLLARTALSQAQIARAFGFSSRPVFARAYAAEFGEAPGQARIQDDGSQPENP